MVSFHFVFREAKQSSRLDIGLERERCFLTFPPLIYKLKKKSEKVNVLLMHYFTLIFTFLKGLILKIL